MRPTRPSTPLRVCLVFAVLVAAAPTAAAPAAAPVGAAEGRTARAVRERHAQGRYPDDLMVNGPPDASEGRQGGRASRGRIPLPVFGDRNAPALSPEPFDPDWDWPELDFPDWLAAWLASLGPFVALVVKALLYACLGLLGLALGYLLLRLRLPKRRGAVSSARPKPRVRDSATESAADPLLASPSMTHEEFARQGRFTEAVHALFVDAIERSGFRSEGRARAKTAREVVAAYGSAGKEPLQGLLGRAERAWFGGVEADEAAYGAALEEHRRFVGSLPA